MKVSKSIILNKRILEYEKNNVFKSYRFNNKSKYRSRENRNCYYKHIYLEIYFIKMLIKMKISI